MTMKFLLGFKYAAKGLWLVVTTQRNMRVHLVVVVLVALPGFYFQLGKSEWLFIIVFYAMVLAAEIFNTAIEKLVDLKSPEINRHAGEIKDVSAAAVLIIVIMAIIAGLIIFVPYLLHYFNGIH